MKPYIDRGNLTSEERSFNIKYSMTREVVEIAFGRLKGRFRGIGKRLDLKVYNACNVIAASCILRNYCGMLNDFFGWQMARWCLHSCWSLSRWSKPKPEDKCYCNKRCREKIINVNIHCHMHHLNMSVQHKHLSRAKNPLKSLHVKLKKLPYMTLPFKFFV